MPQSAAEILKAQHRAELIGEVMDEETRILAWRIEQFIDCGFTDEQSLALANGKDDKGFSLDWHDAHKLLSKGRSPEWVYNYMRDE